MQKVYWCLREKCESSPDHTFYAHPLASPRFRIIAGSRCWALIYPSHESRHLWKLNLVILIRFVCVESWNNSFGIKMNNHYISHIIKYLQQGLGQFPSFLFLLWDLQILRLIPVREIQYEFFITMGAKIGSVKFWIVFENWYMSLSTWLPCHFCHNLVLLHPADVSCDTSGLKRCSTWIILHSNIIDAQHRSLAMIPANFCPFVFFSSKGK